MARRLNASRETTRRREGRSPVKRRLSWHTVRRFGKAPAKHRLTRRLYKGIVAFKPGTKTVKLYCCFRNGLFLLLRRQRYYCLTTARSRSAVYYVLGMRRGQDCTPGPTGPGPAKARITGGKKINFFQKKPLFAIFFRLVSKHSNSFIPL